MKTAKTLAAAVLLVGLTVPAQAKLRVVTSLQDLASIAEAIGGDHVETVALARGYQDPHFVDAKPSFILKLSRADLLIVAGLELEIGYLPPLIDQSRNDKIHPGNAGYLDASIGCDILQKPTEVVTRAMGDVHPYGNPHYWTDPENGRVVAPRDQRQSWPSLILPAKQPSTRTWPRSRPGSLRRSASGMRRWRRLRRQDRDVPRVVAQLRQALQAPNRRGRWSRSRASRRRRRTPWKIIN